MFNKAIDVLQQNLSQEEAMAAWLEKNLRTVTLRFAQLSDAGDTAKV